MSKQNVPISTPTHNIKFLVLDVDGVLTDGGLYYSESGDEFKKFNAKDGMGIKLAMRNGIDVAFLSAGSTKKIVQNRAKTLGIERVSVDTKPKLEILKNWCIEKNIELENVAYIGDDLNDIDVMEAVGFSACPADAVEAVKLKANVILTRKGGDACVREFVDEHLLDD